MQIKSRRKPSVYVDDNFKARVNFASGYISSNRNSTRTFDGCFEMNDGNAVCLALLRRARKNPHSKLARNIWKYLCKDTVEPLADKYGSADLNELSKTLRDQAAAQHSAYLASLQSTSRGSNSEHLD